MTHRQEKTSKFHFDFGLFGVLVLFMMMSLISIYRSSKHIGYSTNGLVAKQLMWYGLGFVTIFIISRLGKEILLKVAKIVYWILLFLMFFLIFVKYVPPLHGPLYRFVRSINGSWAWYQIPGIGSFQPSEFMKICLVFICAQTVDRHNLEIEKASFKTDLWLFAKIGAWALPPLFLNYLQPDTGVPIIVVFSLLFMVYTAGTKNYWFLFIVSVILSGYFGVIYLYYNHPDILGNFFGDGSYYRLRRFYGWLDYEKYSQLEGYQLYSSLISMGMGGLKGVGQTDLIVHIAEAHTDFIFAVIASQFGLLGSLAVVFLCFLLNGKLISIAIKSTDSLSKYIIGGLLGIFMYQQFQNMAMLVGILPITGITLPLISYGGSSLLSYMIGLSYPFIAYSHTKNNPVYEEGKIRMDY